MVSSNVNPVNTRMVSCFSLAVSVPHEGMSLDTGTFSGNQKLPVSRSQTSASFSSCKRFQLIAETRSISFIPSDTWTPFRRRSRFARPAFQTLPLVCDIARNRDILCWRVARDTEEAVLRKLEFARREPILPGEARPERPV